jgi:hypothetical protein
VLEVVRRHNRWATVSQDGVADDPIPVVRLEISGAAAFAERQVWSEQAAEGKDIDHHAAGEVRAVTSDAGVARRHQVLATLDRTLLRELPGGVFGESQRRDLGRIERERNREIRQVSLERLREQPTRSDGGPRIDTCRGKNEQDEQYTNDLQQFLDQIRLQIA